MGWEVSLTGDVNDLGIFAKSFTGADFTISKVGKEFLLTSSEFEALGDAAKIRDRAAAFVELLNGAARLALESKILIGVSAVNHRHADGRCDIFVLPEPATIQPRVLAPSMTITHVDGSTETYHPADPIRDWIKLASHNPAVAKTLGLLSSGVWDWVNLYRIFEVVASDCGSLAKMQTNGWATMKMMKLFKHTANSPGAVGTGARHGAEYTSPPAKPMLLSEAKSLVLGIVQAWLREKTNSP